MQSCVGRTMAKTSSKENEMAAQGGPKTGVRVAAPGQRREESLKYSYGEVWGYLLLCTLDDQSGCQHKRGVKMREKQLLTAPKGSQ